MITIKNVKTLKGNLEDVKIQSQNDATIHAEGKLTLLPGLIDMHVHFRTPGHEHKEDWTTAAQAAIAGGITTVFDMPNNDPPCVDGPSLDAKSKTIAAQLAKAKIPLRYYLYIGADKAHLETIGQAKGKFIAIKVYMGSSTGGLLMEDDKALHRVFQIAAQENCIVSVHAEDEARLKENSIKYAKNSDPAVHSLIRDRKAAALAVEKAIYLAEKYSAQLFIHHVSTKDELTLIRYAKARELLVFAETTPHHLFLSENDYVTWGTKVQVNPPLRTKEDQEALWEGIRDNTIDTIASDHAPHTLKEKSQPYRKAPSGLPGVETTLPLLLNAVHENKITLDKIVHCMRINPERIFNLPHNNDVILVDLELEKEVSDGDLKTKCRWSPYSGKRLKGWPVYTILNGNVFKVG